MHGDYERGLGVLLKRRATVSTVKVGETVDNAPSMPFKGIFERGGSYPTGGFVQFALSLRCDSVIFLESIHSAEKVTQALAAGLSVWFYGGPTSWNQTNFRNTRERMVELCATNHQIRGYVANPEEAWSGATPELVRELGSVLHEDSLRYSVGLASIPFMPNLLEIARMAPHVWGAPELYGIRSPGTPAELLARGNRWRPLFAGYCPCIAAWGRDAVEQREYLRGMSSLPRVMMWHNGIPRGAVFAALRDFVPLGSRSTFWRNILATFGVGLLGAVALNAVSPK
jgi:hypothetical protein